MRSSRSGTISSRSATSSIPWTSVCSSTSRSRPAAAYRRSSSPKITSDRDSAEWSSTMSACERVGAREQVAQHPDHRGDAGAGGDEQQLAGHRVGEHEVALGLAEVDHLAGTGPVDQVVGDHAVGDGLDRDADAAVGTGAVGQGVGAPQAHAVDVDADAEVLAGHVAGPVPAGLDDQGRGVGGLGVDGHDPAAQGGAGAQRVEHVQHVVELERGHRCLGEPSQAVAQGAAGDRDGWWRTWLRRHGG